MSKNHVFVDLAPQKTLQAEENDKKTYTLCWIAAIGVVASLLAVMAALALKTPFFVSGGIFAVCVFTIGIYLMVREIQSAVNDYFDMDEDEE